MVTRLLRRMGIAVALVSGGALTACDTGPFARVNPGDPDATVSIRIVASSDTATVAQPYIAFQVVVEPASGPLSPTWESNNPTFVHQGDGVFQMVTPPSVVVPIDVRVRFPAGTAVYRVYGAPPP